VSDVFTFENVPQEMKALNQWVCWKFKETTEKDGTVKKRKIPCKTNGIYASSINVSTWTTFDKAVSAVEEGKRVDGIGFVFTDESGIVGVDFDHIIENGVFTPDSLEEVKSLNSYSEISPSGTGVHVYIFGEKEGEQCKFKLPDKTDREVYNNKRFFTVTGQTLNCSSTVNKSQEALNVLCAKWELLDTTRKEAQAEERNETLKSTGVECLTSPEMNDEEILKICRRAKNKDKFKKLFAGDISEYNNDASAADQAFCNILAFYTQKPEQIDRIFRQSKLMRDKWEREDYREWTVTTAIDSHSEYYQKNNSKKKEKITVLVPEELTTILKKAEEDGITGVPNCLKWIAENSEALFTLPRCLLLKEIIDARAGIFEMPEVIKDIGRVFKLETENLEIIYDRVNTINCEYHKEKKRIELTIARINTYPEIMRSRAEQELLTGDPYKFNLDTWKRRHIGDEVVGQTLIACAGSTFIVGKNAGLHFKPSGESGKGKTSGVDTFLDQLPPSMIIRGGLSDKYIYYGDDINAGSICFVDDRDLSDNLKEVVKNSISNFQKPEFHRTVINGTPKKFRASPRTSWIFASVDGFDDEQIDNRFLKADVDSTHEQDEKVAEFQRKGEFSDILTSDNEDLEVCKCMFDILSLFTYDIRVPYAEAIIWNHVKNRRNQPKFIDIIRSVCLYKIYQRECVSGCFLANMEDYTQAVEIYKGTATQNNINLTAQEQKVLNVFITQNKAVGYYKNPLKTAAARMDIEELMDATGFKRSRLVQILEGRRDRNTYGMFDKVDQLYKEESETGRKTLYFYKGNVDFSTFERFTSIKSTEDVEKLTENIKRQLQSTTASTVTIENDIRSRIISNCYHLLPSVTKQMVTVKSTSVSSKGVLIYNTVTTFSEKRETQNFCVSEFDRHSTSGQNTQNENFSLCGSKTRDFGNSTVNQDKKVSSDNENTCYHTMVTVGNSWCQSEIDKSTDSDLLLPVSANTDKVGVGKVVSADEAFKLFDEEVA